MFTKKSRSPETDLSSRSNAILERIRERAAEQRNATFGALAIDQTIVDQPAEIVKDEVMPYSVKIENLCNIVYELHHANRTASGTAYNPFKDPIFLEKRAPEYLKGMTSDERVSAFMYLRDLVNYLEVSTDTVQLPRHIGRHATAEVATTPK